jgi:hypothetical protein
MTKGVPRLIRQKPRRMSRGTRLLAQKIYRNTIFPSTRRRQAPPNCSPDSSRAGAFAQAAQLTRLL